MSNSNIVYEPKIISTKPNYKEKIYTGTAETNLKQSFINHMKSFTLKQYENDTKLSKEYWGIKRNHFTPKVTWGGKW